MKVRSKKAGILFITVTVLLINGCASTGVSLIKMEKSEFDKLKTHPEISAIQYTPAPFRLVTTETTAASGIGVLFGPLGGALGAAATIRKLETAGAEMVNQYSLQDPILRIKEYFLRNLVEQLGFKNIHSVPNMLADDGVETLKDEFGKKVVIDFKTFNWGLIFYPYNRAYYRVPVAARVRIINVSESKIIWQGICEILEEKTEGRKTLEEFTANNGEFLKANLSESASHCSEDLISQLSNFK